MLDLYGYSSYNTYNMTNDFRPSPDEPAYRHIAEQFRTRLATGDLKPGDRLPAIRALAIELHLDAGTVARAYAELRREGLIVNRRGAGSFIAPKAGEGSFAVERRRRLETIAERAVVEALGLGFGIEDIETAITLRIADWRERRAGGKTGRAPRKPGGRTIRFHGSHDLAVELLASHLTSTHAGVRFETSFVGSMAGLMALAGREADVAGTHLVDEVTGECNAPFVRRILPEEQVVLITLMERVQGLMVKPGNPKHIIGIVDLARPDVQFVNRQNGSGTRILLDSLLRKQGIAHTRVKGYAREEKTHVAVARTVAECGADVGLGAQSAAGVSGLDFIPLVKERYDLAVLKESLAREPLSLIPEVVRSTGFRAMLGAVPGYDTRATGRTVNVSPGGIAKGK